MRYIITLIFINLLCINHASADSGLHSGGLQGNKITVALFSELGDSVPYYDQGFGSLMKNQLDIPARGAIDTAVRQAISLALSRLGYAVTFRELSQAEYKQILDCINGSRDLFPSAEKRVDHLKESGIFSLLNEGSKADFLITVKKEPARYEHISGIGVVTKNGLLGITHLTRVYLAAQMAIYQVSEPMETGYALTDDAFVQMPSIYQDWEKEVVAGLSPKIEADISEIISRLLHELTLKTFSTQKKLYPET